MNWKEISEKYPKTFKELIWLDSVNTLGLTIKNGEIGGYELIEGMYYNYNIRNLYDFFDEYNFNICITSEYYQDGINWSWQILWLDPNEHDCMDGTMQHGDNGEYGIRADAEEAAFTKAFELLEKKLNKQQ